MIKDFSKNIVHFIPLLGILLFSTLGFWFFSYNREFQFAIAAATSVSYVVWGVVHHIIHKDFNWSVFLEYFCISIIGFVILSFMIMRA